MLRKNSRILLLDEPTAQIDYMSQQKVLGALYKNAFDSQMTVLMIAHRLETAITFSDKVLVMDKGQVMEFDHSFVLLVYDPQSYLDVFKRDKEYIEEEPYHSAPSKPTRDSLFSSMVRALPLQK